LAKIEFICPSCESPQQLEGILTNADVTRPITAIDDGELEESVEYDDDKTVVDGMTARFQCAQCGFIIRDAANNVITDDDELVYRIKEAYSEPHTTVGVSFSARGGIDMRIEIRKSGMTPEDLVNGLNAGTIQTTVQYGGKVMVTETGELVGDIVRVDNNMDYEDFELEEKPS
jgi:hypothetical protein